jgi:hypothetical protein
MVSASPTKRLQGTEGARASTTRGIAPQGSPARPKSSSSRTNTFACIHIHIHTCTNTHTQKRTIAVRGDGGVGLTEWKEELHKLTQRAVCVVEPAVGETFTRIKAPLGVRGLAQVDGS